MNGKSTTIEVNCGLLVMSWLVYWRALDLFVAICSAVKDDILSLEQNWSMLYVSYFC